MEERLRAVVERPGQNRGRLMIHLHRVELTTDRALEDLAGGRPVRMY
jgi:hypothetical protein